MTASTNRRIKAALAFAARGWPVFPLTPGAKKPLRHCPQCDRKSPEYVPHRGIDACPHPADTCHGFHAASADPERIEDWGRRFPEMNLGIATGPARLVVVDLDRNKAGTPPPAEYEGMGVIDGGDVFALALERYGQTYPGETLIVGTPSHGLHLYWRLPDGVTVNKSEGDFGWLIDVRAAGSYIVAPTSTTPEGEYRRLSAGLDPLPAPRWLLHHLEGTGHMPKPPRPARPAVVRHQYRPASGGYASIGDLAAQLANADVGQRHKVLCRVTTAAAYLVAAGQCTDHEMRAEIYSAGRAAERDEDEIEDAIETAFDYVARRGAA
jgi:hypothetical protein